MRLSYSLVCALLSPAVIGCSDSIPTPPPPTPVPTTAVHVKSGNTPRLIAYRDGFTDDKLQPVAWTVVPNSTDAMFTVLGAYSVVVVCDMGPDTVLTWQMLRAVEDDDDVTQATRPPIFLDTPCQDGPTLSTITGTAAAPGFVHIDASDDAPTTGHPGFSLSAIAGTYDFVVSDTSKALITRGFVVSAPGPTPTDATSVADASAGSALVPITPSLSNSPSPPPPPDEMDPNPDNETVVGQVEVKTANNSGPAKLFVADFERDTMVNTKQVVTVYGLPDAAVAEKGDTQSVRFIATDLKIPDTNISTTRSVVMPFKMSDDVSMGKTQLGLPSRLATSTVVPGWGVDNTSRLGVALPALPALDTMTIATSGTTSDGSTTVKYEMHITGNYFGDTSLAHPLFDTAITGFLDTWKIDFNKASSRDIDTEHDTLDADTGAFISHESSTFHEDVPAKQP